MEDLFSVADKVVIVTGASRGIGAAVARGFIARGARLVCTSRSDESMAQLAALAPDRVAVVGCDLAQANAVAQISRVAEKRFGNVDVLINNAGTTTVAADPYQDEVSWDRTLQVNLKAAFLLGGAVAKIMERQGSGSIINIASIGALLGFPDNPSYQAAKGGLRQLSRAMARDFGSEGIRVNTICPGYIRTQMTERSYQDQAMRQARTSRTLLGRWGDPEDLVGACLFLASDASSYITGADLAVDGGWTAQGL